MAQWEINEPVTRFNTFTRPLLGPKEDGLGLPGPQMRLGTFSSSRHGRYASSRKISRGTGALGREAIPNRHRRSSRVKRDHRLFGFGLDRNARGLVEAPEDVRGQKQKKTIS